MADLTLTGAIPGLLRRGSPAWWRDEETPYVVTISYRDADHAEWVVAAPCAGLPIGVQDDPSNFTLDLTDPTGRYHALLWLRERGHDLRWAEDEAEVLAWSVLSVSRGGGVIEAIGDVPRFVNTAVCVMTWFGATLWWAATEADRDHYTDPLGGHSGWGWLGESGQETGDDALRAICTAALRAGYALRNPDGTLTLPELPPEAP